MPRANWNVCWTERDWKLPNCLSVGLSHAHAWICQAACLPELHRGNNCQSSVRGSRTCPGSRIQAQPTEPKPDMQCLSGHTTHRHGKAWSIHGMHSLLQWGRCDMRTRTQTKSARCSSSASSKHDQQRACNNCPQCSCTGLSWGNSKTASPTLPALTNTVNKRVRTG